MWCKLSTFSRRLFKELYYHWKLLFYRLSADWSLGKIDLGSSEQGSRINPLYLWRNQYSALSEFNSVRTKSRSPVSVSAGIYVRFISLDLLLWYFYCSISHSEPRVWKNRFQALWLQSTLWSIDDINQCFRLPKHGPNNPNKM